MKNTCMIFLLFGILYNIDSSGENVTNTSQSNKVKTDAVAFLEDFCLTFSEPYPYTVEAVTNIVDPIANKANEMSHDMTVPSRARDLLGTFYVQIFSYKGELPLKYIDLQFNEDTKEADANQTTLSQLMGHSTLQMTSRYVANNTDAHVQANQDLAKKIMSFIQAPGQSNTMESAGPGCRIETKPVAKPVADHGVCENARKGETTGRNVNACDYAI